jgi:PEGA domain-containing protein
VQTLLFCKDEKSANVLIQLVQKLDVGVTHEIEVLSAIRSLMAEYFDFLIIDSEDVQTTRLLLKNARGSAMNKNALIVAVGVPETGASAFRLGAEFLVPKPITPGQAEPILRRVRAAILRGQHSRTEDETTSTPGTPSQLRQEAVLPPEVGGSQGLATKAVAAGAGRGGDGANAKIANAEPNSETSKITVDPTKSKETWGSKDRRFSKTDEMPLKEGDQVASPRAPAATTETLSSFSSAAFQRAGEGYITPRHVTNDTVMEIKKAAAKRWVVSITAAIAVVMLITIVIGWRIHSKDSLRDHGAPVHSSAVAVNTPSNAEVSASQSTPPGTSTAPPAVAPEPLTAELPATEPVTSAVVPGELGVNSPSSSVQVEAQRKSVGAKPHSLSRRPLSPRNAVVTKPGHAPKVRTIKGSSRNDSASLPPVPLTAVVLVNSDPEGAAVWMDGMDTRQTTPARISLGKSGNHTFVLKKQGYMEETATAKLEIGQTIQLAPSLHALGRTDQIKMVGKFKKLFGASDKAGMGMVSVKTQPKGAQIAINTRILDKTSPAQFYVNPGSYMIDMTLVGFKSVHRVVSVEKGDKIAIDEVMDRD